MKFEGWIKGKLIKRYLRFLAEVELADGSVITAHCTNTGSMKSCLLPGAPVLLSPNDNPNRKTKFTWEAIEIEYTWIGVNTNRANQWAFEWVAKNEIPGLEYLQDLKREKKFGDSRFDIYGHDGEKEVWMEVKNVSMKEGDFALFPDAPTTRGQKHLKTLMQIVKDGQRAAMIYVIQRSDIQYFAAAKEIDPLYAELLEEAKKVGVEVYALQVELSKNAAFLKTIIQI